MKHQKWSIWRANLDPVIGSEQGKSRPVIIISENDINKLLNIVNIITLTTRKPNRLIYPNEVLIKSEIHGLKDDSLPLCHQIGTIDKRRLSMNYGKISNKELQKNIIDAICFQLGIKAN